MAFEDDLVQALARQGISLSRANAPSADAASAGTANLSEFFQELDTTTLQALQEVLAGFPIQSILASADCNVAPSLKSVFEAADHSNARISIEGLISVIWSVAPGGTVDQQRGSPTIDSLLPKQGILGHPAQITVHWSSNKAFDVYHLMATQVFPPPPPERGPQGWITLEFSKPGSHDFLYTFHGVKQNEEWSFKVQGCVTDILGSSCSPFSSVRSVKVPVNTRSVRTFLDLSGVPAPRSLRSLGSAVTQRGLKAAMNI
jgi:hypothetical protein